MSSLRIFSLSALFALAGGTAWAGEFSLGAYGGWTGSDPSDVHYTQGSDVTLSNVPWLGQPWKSPPYWGLRATYWLDSMPGWGVMLDYAHAKVYADMNASVNVIDNGTSTTEQVGDRLDVLEFTDGLNLLTLNAVYRAQPIGRLRPYAGIGAGISVPHVEFRRNGQSDETFRYELTGPAVQAEVGVDVKLTRHISAFGAYKINYTWNRAELDGGGTLETDILTHQALFGVAWHLDPKN